MPAKKKKAKKTETSEKEPKPPTKLYAIANAYEQTLLKSQENKQDWLHIDVKLVTWVFANFEVLNIYNYTYHTKISCVSGNFQLSSLI